MKSISLPMATTRIERTAIFAQPFWATVGGMVLALVFSFYYLKHTHVMNEADPRLLVEFAGNRPYQLRILLPAIINVVTHWTSLDIASCTQLLTMGFAVALYFAMANYLAQFTSLATARWLALGLYVPLFAFYSNEWFYLYDIPSAFFATLGLSLMVQRKWRLFLLTFAFATLNRETSAFLVLAFVLTTRDKLPRAKFLALLGTQAFIWLAIRQWLTLVFSGNPGKMMEWQLPNNWKLLRFYAAHFDFTLCFAFAVLLGLWAIGAATRQYQPEFLRRSRSLFWPFMVSMSCVGVLTETRIYSELIPILLASALMGVFNWSQARSL